MNVLIVESDPDLGRLWQRHMERQGLTVRLEADQQQAISALQTAFFAVIVLDLVLSDGSALAVADYASYKHPEAQIIFVNSTSFFSDGSIFELCSNARAFVHNSTPPEDLATMVAHYGRHSPDTV
ncbi:response regulator transcription factor [Roseovarius dicentrarchi]|uniref:response regulator transcription factor n=1 Tax=Roseovarius dicentrarchi TaxID=2250573 RepID=UPI000DEB4ED3|nr:response regulator [Roseovarius dicentrarchi]